MPWCRLGVIWCAVTLASAPLWAQQRPREDFRWPVVPGGESLPTLILTAPPRFSVGSVAGPEYTLFSGLAGAVMQADGGIAVGDAGNNRIVFFDSTGRLQRSIGRLGDGPGEFRQQRWLGRCANGNLAVHDGVHARLNYFSPEGRPLQSDALPVGANFDRMLWCAGSEGRMLMLFDRPRDPVKRGEYFRAPVSVVRIDGPAIDTSLVGAQEYYIGDRVRAGSTVPLGEDAGSAAAAGRLYVCETLTARCSVFDTSAVRLRSFVVPNRGLTRRVTNSDWQLALERHLDGEPTASSRKIARSVLKEVRPRRQFPKVDRIAGDDDGNLWVRTFDNFRSSIATWVVVDEHGTPIGLAATDRRLHVLRAGRDYLIGVRYDQDGVEHVEMHRFRPFLRR